jgi:hypothetical protein
MFGITPLTIAEYLFSANNNNLIPLLAADSEDGDFG